MHNDPPSYLPLTEATFCILLSLSGGQKHGYAILKDVESLSDGTVSLSVSTLYSTLRRLLGRGLIERISEGTGDHAGPGLPRKAYALSQLGRRILRAETSRMRELVAAARLRLGEEGI